LPFPGILVAREGFKFERKSEKTDFSLYQKGDERGILPEMIIYFNKLMKLSKGSG
jgi:hypothetical protein